MMKVIQGENEFGVKKEQEGSQQAWNPADEGEQWLEVMLSASKICRTEYKVLILFLVKAI